MCLLVVLSRVVPGHPLVVAANRDERTDRPAIALTVLEEGPPRILGGRDLLAGGTWLAVNEHGVVAGLTNRPTEGGRDPTKRSRGELPLVLAEASDADSAVERLAAKVQPADYNPCWILVGDRRSLHLVDLTEPAEASAASVRPLPAGLHVLENRPPSEASPKAQRVSELLGWPPPGPLDELARRLVQILSDHTVAPGAPEERPEVAACCVHSEGYGTSSSALVFVGEDDELRPDLRVADGPPCTSEYRSASSLW